MSADWKSIARTLLPAILTLCPGSPLAGQDGEPFRDDRSLPEGALGEHLKALLEVAEQGGGERIDRLIAEHFIPAYRQGAGGGGGDHHDDPYLNLRNTLFDLHQGSQGFDFLAIRHASSSTDPNQTVAILKNRLTGAFEAITLHTDPSPPHLLSGLGRDAARPPEGEANSDELDEIGLARELKSFLERVSAAGLFSGTVLVGRDGEVLYAGAFGLASRRFDVPNRIDTRFNLGSMNKMFTAVAVAQLAERGRLEYEDTLDRFLSADWLPNVDLGTVQVRHLLTHTSGLGSYFNREYMRGSRMLWREVEDYKPLVAGERLAFAPGSRWSYSNTGMLLLGAVIEKASGQNYFDYVRENIYAPAGMPDSDSYDMDRPVKNLAIGYSKEDRGDGLLWTNNLYEHVIRGGPAGGGFSTVPDLHAFAVALLNHELVDEESTELLLSPKPELFSPEYGYGFSIEEQDGETVVGHGGGFSGISAKLDMHLDSGFVVAVLSNRDGGSRIVLEKLRTLLPRIP